MSKKILQVLNGQVCEAPPVWMMRQAGRYLPEYRELRATAGSFLNLVYDPVKAAEVTIQPIRRFAMDAAILFSDILVVPQAMGANLRFTQGEGPQLDAVRGMDDLARLDHSVVDHTLGPIYETVSRVRDGLITEGFDFCTLIGFAGSPWTIACYMVAGDARDHDFVLVKETAYRDPVFFDALIEKITDVTIGYLRQQILAGAEVVQLFDSWAGVAGGELFDRYVIAPSTKIVQALRTEFPQVPVIGFPRLAGNRIGDYARQTSVRAVGVDTISSMKHLRDELPGTVLQGNFDPIALLSGGKALEDAIARIKSEMMGTPYIFNLGHGIVPPTPIDHVARAVELIRK